MAKRRNLKKEKALRNQAYARKFRKRSGSSRFSRRRPPNSSQSDDNTDEQDTETSDSSDSND